MTGATPTGDISTLRDYLQVVWRRKWIILAATIIVLVAAVGYSLRQHAEFEGSAQVLLQQQNLGSELTGTQSASTNDPNWDATQAQVARVPDVAQRAVHAAGMSMSPAAFLSASSVSSSTTSDILTFNVTADSSALASRLASAYARAYVSYSLAIETSSIVAARRELQARISHTSHGPLYNTLVAKEQTLDEMRALETSNANVISTAGPAVQVAPKTSRNAILGFVLGLVLGLGLAFLWEALDTRVRTAGEVGETLGLPLLARLPAPPRRLQQTEQLAMIAEPHSVGSEAFRMLRTNLEFVRLGRDARTIMITSALEREGKSTTIANLAVALALSGHHVALVDLDLHRPFLGHFFDLSAGAGLTEVAIGEATLDDALTDVPIGEVAGAVPTHAASGNGNASVSEALRPGSLSVLGSGMIPPNVGEFVGSEAVASILSTLRTRFDTVLVDCPPSLLRGDAMALSRHVDGILVISRLNVVRRPMLNELKRLLDASPVRSLGFIASGAETEGGYGYRQEYSYGDEPAENDSVIRRPMAGRQT